jgi:hypothetical protein
MMLGLLAPVNPARAQRRTEPRGLTGMIEQGRALHVVAKPGVQDRETDRIGCKLRRDADVGGLVGGNPFGMAYCR